MEHRFRKVRIDRVYFITTIASYVKAETLYNFLTSFPLKETKDKFVEIVQWREDASVFIHNMLEYKDEKKVHDCAYIMTKKHIKRQTVIDKMNTVLALRLLGDDLSSEMHTKITSLMLEYYPVHSLRIRFTAQPDIIDGLERLANRHKYRSCLTFLKKYPITSFDISDSDILDRFVKKHIKNITPEENDLVMYLYEISKSRYNIFEYIFEQFIYKKNNRLVKEMSKDIIIKHHMIEIALRAKNYKMVNYLSDIIQEMY